MGGGVLTNCNLVVVYDGKALTSNQRIMVDGDWKGHIPPRCVINISRGGMLSVHEDLLQPRGVQTCFLTLSKQMY